MSRARTRAKLWELGSLHPVVGIGAGPWNRRHNPGTPPATGQRIIWFLFGGHGVYNLAVISLAFIIPAPLKPLLLNYYHTRSTLTHHQSHKMFARVVALATAASLFVFAAAAPGPQAAAQCNGGTIQCCNQAQEVEKVDKKTTLIMQLIGLDVSNLTGMVGSNCSPLSVLAIGGNSWYV